MTPKKIPIFLLTGFLGSGKTSLLKNWLQSPELKDSALIINELGEIGVDQALLTSATEAASLVSNACVCCTGLQGLSQALEDLFWARLQRRVHQFPQLVIETTGLAMPGPILETLKESPLLLERYEWAGTITCVSSTHFREVLLEFKEAQAQLTKADVCILTKTDLISPEELRDARSELGEFLAHHGLTTPVLNSSCANLSAPILLETLRGRESWQHQASPSASASTSISKLTQHNTQDAQEHHADGAHHEHGEHHEHEHGHGHGDEHEHHHDHLHAQAHFWHMSETRPLSTRLLEVQQLKDLMGRNLLRLKGWVQTPDGAHLIQMSPFDYEPQVEALEPLQPTDPDPKSNPRPWGLTVIVKDGVSKDKSQAMKAMLGL